MTVIYCVLSYVTCSFSHLQLSHWLALALKPLNASLLSSPMLASLHGVLPQLGASFLQSLSSNDLLELFSQPDIPTFPPAQVNTHSFH